MTETRAYYQNIIDSCDHNMHLIDDAIRKKQNLRRMYADDREAAVAALRQMAFSSLGET